MKGRNSTLAAITALTLVSLAAPLSAAPKAGTTPLKIDAKGAEHGEATFMLIGANSADSDSGALTRKDDFGDVMKSANGQAYALNSGTSSFKSKRGTLVLRTTGKTYFMDDYEVWIGTWKIVSGKGKYAGMKGTGGFTAIHPGDFTYSIRYEGLVTRP